MDSKEDKKAMKKIGIIGIGKMGNAIAINLMKRGYAVNFYTRRPSYFEDRVISSGGSKKITKAQLAHDSQVILLCVTGTPEVEQIIYGEDGLFESILPGTIVIDCSTSIPESTLRIAADIEGKNAYYLDAALARTPKEAEEGRLNLLVGASQELFDQCLPIFQCFAENIEHIGPLSYGHRLKLIHNFVALGFSAVMAEAVACAKAADIDMNSLLAVLSKGAGEGAIMRRFQPYILEQDDASFRFTISNASKDLEYYLAMAKEHNASSEMAKTAGKMYANAVVRSDPESTVPKMIDILGIAPA